MKFARLMNSFRLRLLMLLTILLGLTLSVQYYVNLRAAQNYTRLIAEQEHAIMAGVALGFTTLTESQQYLKEIRDASKDPLLDPSTGRVKNVLIVDKDGLVRDSQLPEYAPKENDDKTVTYAHWQDVPVPAVRSAVRLAD